MLCAQCPRSCRTERSPAVPGGVCAMPSLPVVARAALHNGDALGTLRLLAQMWQGVVLPQNAYHGTAVPPMRDHGGGHPGGAAGNLESLLLQQPGQPGTGIVLMKGQLRMIPNVTRGGDKGFPISFQIGDDLISRTQ